MKSVRNALLAVSIAAMQVAFGYTQNTTAQETSQIVDRDRGDSSDSQPEPVDETPAVLQEDTGTPEEQALRKTIVESMPLLEIKRLETEKPLYSIELRNVPLSDLFRVLAHDYDLNILLDKEITGTISASFTSIPLEEALDRIADMHDLIIEKKGSVLVVKPNLVAKIFVLEHIEAKAVIAQGVASSAGQPAGAGTVYGLLSREGQLLAGNQPNSIMVMDYPKNIKKIEEYFSMVDKGLEAKVFRLKYVNARDLVGAVDSAASPSTPNP